MRGYGGINLPLSGCVHFVRASEKDSGTKELAHELQNNGLTLCYVDEKNVVEIESQVANVIGQNLKLGNFPYGEKPWVPFLDDLITASHRMGGLVIVVDNAHLLLKLRQCEFFDLIESFLIQWHHWAEKKKACHLCLQMEPDQRIRDWFCKE